VERRGNIIEEYNMIGPVIENQGIGSSIGP